jgi:hypothetical protein
MKQEAHTDVLLRKRFEIDKVEDQEGVRKIQEGMYINKTVPRGWIR